MMTNDLASADIVDAPKRARRAGRAAGAAALSLTLGLVLAGCTSSEGMYIEGWWDNGDPFYAPSKTVLFDENGVATCEYPIRYLGFESRSNPIGLAQAISFEFTNPETPVDAYMSEEDFPTEEDREKELLRRERALGAVDILWEYTHPLFDEEYGIDEPSDLTPIKEEMEDYLYGLGKDANIAEYLESREIFFVSDQGTFVVVRIPDVRGYLEDNDIPLEFEGLAYSYFTATSEDGEEFLLVKERDTGLIDMWQGSETYELMDAVWYYIIGVKTSLDSPSGLAPVVAEYTLQSDGCPEAGGRDGQRFFLRSYELVDETTEENNEPEPEPTA